MKTLITNVTIFTNDSSNAVLYGHAVLITRCRITEIGKEIDLKNKYTDCRIIDGGGRLLMPGFINTHMHFYSTFARGIVVRRPPQDFYEILSLLWWRLDSALDLKSVYYSALIQVISGIKNGVTAVIDHHSSPNAIAGSLDQIEEALNLLGMRGTLCYEMSDREGRDVCQGALEENARYIQKCRVAKRLNPDHLFDAMVGLHASFTLDDGSLRRAAELSWSTDRGCHIHVLEDEVDRTITARKYERGVAERLNEFGILGEKTIAAHGVFLDPTEMHLLAASNTNIVHNPQSNMNNAVGRADILKMIDDQILVGLGTDGMSADIKTDARTAQLLHKHALKNANVGWLEIQKMLLKNNPAIYEKVTGQKIGRIAEGFLADLILVDYYPPTPLTGDTIWAHILYGIADAQVDTTIINGKVIMQNKQIPGLDEAEIARHARECAEEVWERFEN